MRIRKTKKEDFKEIAEILMKESSKNPYNEKYNLKIALKEITKLSKNDFYVAVNEKEIIGFIASNITPDNKKKAYITELWLRPVYQKKGVGKALVRFIEEKYKKKGVNLMRVLIKRNAGAFNFYKKIKYKEYKELVFMEKKLK
ncbi:putative acetyltransferase [archaeon BMS3Abin17]|nr:putative acetyltransferase [archaeon BMS3Abin17]HDZ60476.1 N-acetyltransferase [Candidatus Pacearchaeota archaeon]